MPWFRSFLRTERICSASPELRSRKEALLVDHVEIDQPLGGFALAVRSLEGFDDPVAQDLVALQPAFLNRASYFDGPDLELPAAPAELLDHAASQADVRQHVADVPDVGRVFEHDPDQGSFAEIDAELEAAADEDVEHPGGDDDESDDKGDAPVF